MCIIHAPITSNAYLKLCITAKAQANVPPDGWLPAPSGALSTGASQIRWEFAGWTLLPSERAKIFHLTPKRGVGNLGGKSEGRRNRVTLRNRSAPFENVGRAQGASRRSIDERDESHVRELEKEVMDLKITNRGKDYFIEQLKSEREAFAQEVLVM